jgi:hypothetical protein
MKVSWRVVLVGVVVGLAVTGTLLARARGVSAHATTLTFHAIEPGGGTGLTCSGETFFVFGTSNFVLHETTDAAGGVHFDEHISSQHFSGTAQPSGTRYEAPFTSETIANVRPDGGGGYVLTSIVSFRLIGQGPDNNDLFHQTVHLTVNANGELTADTDNTLSFVCQ